MPMPRVLVVVCLGFLACTKGGATQQEPQGTPTDPVRVCASEGQTCVFSEGKLGLCTMKMSGCDAATCFVCMSLH